MNFDWQNLTVLVVVLSAGGYLARVAWQSVVRRQAAGCGSCGHCPTSSLAVEPRLVALQPISGGAPAVSQNGSQPEAAAK
jgi:hypothetical protein